MLFFLGSLFLTLGCYYGHSRVVVVCPFDAVSFRKVILTIVSCFEKGAKKVHTFFLDQRRLQRDHACMCKARSTVLVPKGGLCTERIFLRHTAPPPRGDPSGLTFCVNEEGRERARRDTLSDALKIT